MPDVEERIRAALARHQGIATFDADRLLRKAQYRARRRTRRLRLLVGAGTVAVVIAVAAVIVIPTIWAGTTKSPAPGAVDTPDSSSSRSLTMSTTASQDTAASVTISTTAPRTNAVTLATACGSRVSDFDALSNVGISSTIIGVDGTTHVYVVNDSRTTVTLAQPATLVTATTDGIVVALSGTLAYNLQAVAVAPGQAVDIPFVAEARACGGGLSVPNGSYSIAAVLDVTINNVTAEYRTGIGSAALSNDIYRALSSGTPTR